MSGPRRPGWILGQQGAHGPSQRARDARVDGVDHQAAGTVEHLSGDVEVLYDVLEDNFQMAMDYLATMGRAWLRSMERIADTHPQLLKQFFGCE